MEANITRRKRRRVQRDGSIKHQVRWIVGWHVDGVRNQRFFETRVEAVEFRNRLLTNEAPARPSSVTVGDAIRAWLETRKRTTRTNTHTTYEHRAKLLEPLTSVRIDKLTTKSIREWHDGIDTVYSANKALSVLKSALALHAEDTGTRTIAMPTNLQKRLERPARKHLSIDQVRAVIASDSIYVAFPFLAGTRISTLFRRTRSNIPTADSKRRQSTTIDVISAGIGQYQKKTAHALPPIGERPAG